MTSGRTVDTVTAMENTGPAASTRVVYLVKRLERLIRRDLDATTRRHGLTIPQYTTLSALRTHPGLSSAQLARRAFVTDQSMNEIIIALERDRLIRRTPDPAHQRRLLATLTPHGARALARCDREVDVMEERLLAGMSREEIDQLSRSLHERIQSLDTPEQ